MPPYAVQRVIDSERAPRSRDISSPTSHPSFASHPPRLQPARTHRARRLRSPFGFRVPLATFLRRQCATGSYRAYAAATLPLPCATPCPCFPPVTLQPSASRTSVRHPAPSPPAGIRNRQRAGHCSASCCHWQIVVHRRTVSAELSTGQRLIRRGRRRLSPAGPCPGSQSDECRATSWLRDSPYPSPR